MDLDEDDIESYFTPTIKLFKTGKQYLMRVNISQRIGTTPLKIYDENEDDVDIETINENTSLISILEVQGVRCSTKSFQIDIELKQIMVIKPVNLFEKCIIKRNKQEKDLAKKEPQKVEREETIEITIEEEPEEIKEEEKEEDPKVDQEPKAEEEVFVDQEEEIDVEPQNDDILEINLDVDEIKDSDTIHLKEKTEVYYQMYREARQKAKLAKSLALSSYLEARRIKNLYMLDDIDDSDESDLEEK